MTTTLRSMSQNLNVKVFVKVFKTTLNPNLVTDLIHLLYDDTYWSTFLRSTNPQHPRSCQGQEHRLRILMLKFYTKVFRISLLLNYTMDLVPIWYKDRYCPPSPPPPHTHTHTHPSHVKIKVTDLEFSRNKMCNIRRAIQSGDRSCIICPQTSKGSKPNCPTKIYLPKN